MSEPRTVREWLALRYPLTGFPPYDPDLDAPLIGPDHESVLVGVTVEELAEAGLAPFGEVVKEVPEPRTKAELEAALGRFVSEGTARSVAAILSRLSVRVPLATFTARVVRVTCQRCEGCGEIQLDYGLGTSDDKGNGPWVECSACGGAGTVVSLQIDEEGAGVLAAHAKESVTLAVLAEKEGE